jgi:hypothetical protein
MKPFSGPNYFSGGKWESEEKRHHRFKGAAHEKWEQAATVSYHRRGMKRAMAPFWDHSR